MNQKSHKIHQSNSSNKNSQYFEIDKQNYNNIVSDKFKKEDTQSPRGRKAVTSSNNYSSMNKVKSSTYRNSSSKSTYRFSDRRTNYKQNSYNSDSILSDHDTVANHTSKVPITHLNDPQNCLSEDMSNHSVEYASPDTKAEKTSCNCSSCRQGAGSENSEEQSLSKEIFQIICDIYDAHIKTQEIKETVRRYQQSVHEFCIKESQADIIYLVKLFTKMLSNAIVVSKTILY